MNSNRTTVGILAIILGVLSLGWLGIHKFMMGYTKEGLICIGVSIITCGVGAVVFTIISIVEGIIYLTMTDAQFEATYSGGRKPWF